MNKDKHVLPGNDITTFGGRVRNEAENEAGDTGRRVIYGPDNGLLSSNLTSGVTADLSDKFADDGKLD